MIRVFRIGALPPASQKGISALRFCRGYTAGVPRQANSQNSRRSWGVGSKLAVASRRLKKARASQQPAQLSGIQPSDVAAPGIEKDEHWPHRQDQYYEEKQQDPRRAPYIPAAVRALLYNLFLYAPPVVFFLTFLCPVEPMLVSGASMTPFLNVNSSPELPETSDWILVQRVVLDGSLRARTSNWDVQRGQIIVYLNPTKPETLAVKRVIGIPGDRVKPLPGYSGGDEPVVVPYNHIWVEGDANSREKSFDSNWFGPISQNLVVGFAKVVMTPWYSWTVIRPEEHDYPAKKSGRVEHDVVHEAQVNPDARRLSQAFSDGTAARELATIQANRDRLPTMMREEKLLAKMKAMYAQAAAELQNQNPQSHDVAQGLVEELGSVFEAVGLARDGSHMPPALVGGGSYSTYGDEQELAMKRLKDYVAKHSNNDSKD